MFDRFPNAFIPLNVIAFCRVSAPMRARCNYSQSIIQASITFARSHGNSKRITALYYVRGYYHTRLRKCSNKLTICNVGLHVCISYRKSQYVRKWRQNKQVRLWTCEACSPCWPSNKFENKIRIIAVDAAVNKFSDVTNIRNWTLFISISIFILDAFDIG